MQTLRKKTSPCKYKNEPSRFLGEGVSFKAKLIGILEVSEARGDRMCQEALADLKMAIRAAGEHKQRITIHVAIDGLRLRDEKTGDSLYHHPVHKISFIAQDMSDSRAFGYIFGSPDTGHRFFGIKTDKAASQVVIAMRDLFQVVFELKKKEIELAKQHLEHKTYTATGKSGYMSDSHISSKMSIINESSGASKSPTVGVGGVGDTDKGAVGGPPAEAIADLVDLELELSSIQQGIHQMERITPSDPFGPNKEDPFNSDPFGDSFTSFPKPFLPPPPSSKERSSRVTNVNNTSTDSGSMFSPRPGLLSTSSDASRQDSSMFESPEEGPDWFPANSTSNEKTSNNTTTETNDKAKHEETKNSILAQFDVFTELDPLGTGKSKPYVDKKLFFQELKNPPKKVLKDLVGPAAAAVPSDSKLFQANFESKTDSTSFPIDPFADEDPFDKADPFSDEFKPVPQDPFNTDFIVDFKMYNKQELKPIPSNASATTTTVSSTSNPPPPTSDSRELIDSLKFPPLESILGNSTSSSFDNNLLNSSSGLSKSPVRGLERQISLSTATSSPKSLFSKQNTFDCKFDFHDKRKEMPLLHENPSLDMSSESESTAPEPPPRPTSNITPTIKPPPLPPKKQLGDLSIKPPPRPPHTDIESHYDYIESGPNSLDSTDKSPPLPVPARKLTTNMQYSDWSTMSLPPQRPQKTIANVQVSSQEDYVTPVPPPLLPPQKRVSSNRKLQSHKSPILLPPPQKKDTLKRKQQTTTAIAAMPSVVNSQPDISDITLTDLTTSGVDKLAKKLNLPASKLANMTLVELTAFLQEYISSAKKQNQSQNQSDHLDKTSDITFPAFKAEFSMNFSDFNDSTKVTNSAANSTSFDRYAVFRELLEKEEEKERQSELTNPSLPANLDEENENIDEEVNDNVGVSMAVSLTDEIPVKDTNPSIDRYAALREIVVEDLVPSEEKELNIDANIEQDENEANELKNEQNNLNLDSNKQEVTNDNDLDLFQCVDSKLAFSSDKLNEANIIEYSKPIELEMNDIVIKDAEKEVMSTSKSSPTLNQSALPLNDSNNVQLTSGSLSDAISGSSPEMDNGESPEMKPKETPAESWAIFDNPKKEKPPPEDGLSPWSSDSKEFSSVGPSNEWRHQRKTSPGSGSDNVPRAKHKSKDKDVSGRWWDDAPKSRDIREKYGGHQPARDDRESRHRRDSYEEEYEVDRNYHGNRERRVKMRQARWSRGHQSSSSRDVSPWEEEPCRDWNRRRGPSSSRRSRDSWDEEDDYEYDQHPDQWERRSGSRDRDRHYGRRPPMEEVWSNDDRRHGPRRRYRAPVENEHHCCGDWGEQDSDVGYGNEPRNFGSGSRHSHEWRERNRDDERYYARPASNRPQQESPWEDEYGNEPDDESPNGRSNYLSAKRSWKRPSSASEMDRKTGENKSRQNPYHTMGPTTGSDGERERRYKTTGRRAKSRDSENAYNHRHKIDPMLTLRYRNRDKIPKSPFEDDFSEQSVDTPSPKVKYEFNMAKPSKKSLTSPKSDLESPHSNMAPPSRNKHSPKVESSNRFKFDDFENEIEPQRPSRDAAAGVNFDDEQIRPERDYSNSKGKKKSVFENDFFENDFPKNRESLFDSGEFVSVEKERVSPRLKKSSIRQDSQFEDDFSPSDKSMMTGGDSINSIAEELPESGGVVPTHTSPLSKSVNFTSDTKRWVRTSLRKFPANWRGDLNLKKSESVNIFARENDPFDDDFFSKPENGSAVTRDNGKGGDATTKSSGDACGVQWTEDFDCFDVIEEN